MERKELLMRKRRIEKRLDYLWTNDAIDDEKSALFVPSMVGAVILGLIPMAVLAWLLFRFCDFDTETAIKIAACFYIMLMLLLSVVLREWAYDTATKTVQAQRKKMMRRLDRIRLKINKLDQNLEFINL